MIDIVKKGTPYEDRFFTITCKRCRSDLKFQGDEAIEAINFEYIVCPVCETWLDTANAREIS